MWFSMLQNSFLLAIHIQVSVSLVLPEQLVEKGFLSLQILES
jgi:hypothetical protein